MASYKNEDSENVTKISKTALIDFYEIRGLTNTVLYNERQDVGNRMRADKREKNIARILAICEKWINNNKPIELP